MPDRLNVMWKDPDDRRVIVGTLAREGGEYTFAYLDDLSAAKARGFELLPQFPELRTRKAPYRSGYLFDTFAQRVPSPKRPDYQEILRAYGVKNADDPLEFLAKSGGTQMTDRLAVSAYRPVDDDLSAPLEVALAGFRFHTGHDDIEVGDAVRLVREPDNEGGDEYAVAVYPVEGERLGYVPQEFAPLVAAVMDGGATLMSKAVRRHPFPAPAGKWVIEIRRAG